MPSDIMEENKSKEKKKHQLPHLHTSWAIPLSEDWIDSLGAQESSKYQVTIAAEILNNTIWKFFSWSNTRTTTLLTEVIEIKSTKSVAKFNELQALHQQKAQEEELKQSIAIKKKRLRVIGGLIDKKTTEYNILHEELTAEISNEERKSIINEDGNQIKKMKVSNDTQPSAGSSMIEQ